MIIFLTNHMSCSISKRSPTMMVCLGPMVFIRRVNNPVWEEGEIRFNLALD